jgi:hypothetical protein
LATYNFIFGKLVTRAEDFVGMVAYAIYKRQKIEWIEGFKADNLRDPTDDELEGGFARISNMPSQLESYRQQAVDLIDSFVEYTLAEKAFEVERNIRDDAVIKAVQRSFWSGVGENVVAGVVSSIITVCLVGLAWVTVQGPDALVQQMVTKYLGQEKTPPAPKP